MFGVLLFCLFFSLVCLLIGFPISQTARSWWVKIVTQTPTCTYYFGPFESSVEATLTQNGYVEDLEQEGAMGISVHILQDKPKTLTICEQEW